MNILYIFGNGFDKAQGMATSYPEFYKYLQEHVTSGSNLLDRFNRFIKKHNFSSKDISVITLNYTNTLEKILNLSSGATTKGFDSSNTLRNLIHVHGILGQSIIIGVDNETQN